VQQISSGGLFPVSIAVRDDLVFVINGGGAGAIQGYRIDNGTLHVIPGDNRPLGLNNGNPPNFPAIARTGGDQSERSMGVRHHEGRGRRP
jgi:hypothetical protein